MRHNQRPLQPLLTVGYAALLARLRTIPSPSARATDRFFWIGVAETTAKTRT